MNSENREYNHRQLQLMISAVDKFRNGRIGLGKLVSDLEALATCLRNVSAEWSKCFSSNWSRLEEIHAVSLQRENKSLETSDRDTIRMSIASLASLIKSEIEKYGSGEVV